MIRYIKGNLIHKEDSSAIIENNGIGYKINLPMSSKVYLKSRGDEVEVFTSMIVREDDISLYGFSNMEELKIFEQLITVNGVGSKAAMSIFSTLSAKDIQMAISMEDALPLTKASGIGKKTAQRIVLDLKDKMSHIDATTFNDNDSSDTSQSALSSSNLNKNEALLALETMGFIKGDILGVLKTIDEDLSVEEYIKRVLKYFA